MTPLTADDSSFPWLIALIAFTAVPGRPAVAASPVAKLRLLEPTLALLEPALTLLPEAKPLLAADWLALSPDVVQDVVLDELPTL